MKRPNETTKAYLKLCLKGKGHHLFFLSLIQILLGVLGVGFAFILRYVLRGLEQGKEEYFYIAFFVMIGISLAIVGLQIAYRFLYEVAASDIENSLKRRLFATLLHADYEEVRKEHDEEWIHRLNSDTNIVTNALLSILPSLFRMAVQLIAATAAIAILSTTFIYILIPCIILLLLFTYFLRKRLKQLHREVQEADGRLKIFFAESLEGLSVISSFVKEDLIAMEGDKKMEEHKKAKIRRMNFQNLCAIAYLVVYYLTYLLGILLCGHFILKGEMDVPTLASLLALLTQIQGPLGNITNIIPRYYTLLASAERLTSIKAKEVSPLSFKETRNYYDDEFLGLAFKGVSFSYKDKTGKNVSVMDNFSLEIKKGEKIALTGPSGIGKSTLIALLLGIYKPEQGEVVLESKIGEEPLDASYRHLFSYVPQDNLLFQGSIEEVVTFFDKHVDEAKLKAALKLSAAEEFVNKLDKGVKTDLKEHGSGLSLGQMQRLAIARAIYQDAPIILLDEATSSLDEKIEQTVLDNLSKLKNKTIIFVTHHKAVLAITDKEVAFPGKNE